MVGVAAVVVWGEKILLVRRGREPLKGAWSLPGGLLEVGETLAEGVVREVLEETGVRVRAVEVVATIDRILHDDEGKVQYHYVLVDSLCVPVEGERCELCCGDDADEAVWVERGEISSARYGLGEPTLGVIERALRQAETMTR
jgi:ADP-ribose pyrophosphatase YjhB (NUDIX family)